MEERGILARLEDVARQVQREFGEERRVLSFQEYLELVAAEPLRHSRDAARYVRDAFDHFGRVTLKRPWGEVTRFRLFDLPWLDSAAARRTALVGQEHVQEELYRALSNFVREGRSNRMPLLHGPNGSAKSTVAACVMSALEHYSTLDEGALYRFHWVFPTKSTLKGSIGFSGRRAGGRPITDGSYAHLPDEEVDARLFVEVRDHPLFLIPQKQRQALLEGVYAEGKAEWPPSDWVLRGRLSHKNRQVFDALLASYDGSLDEVLRHVQVERYFISKRYRCGAVTVGPQLSVDAGERQLTADRNLASLPPSLQSVTLFEAFGELVEASGGLLEFSDLLKRPLDAFKYLQLTVETGEVPLRSQTVQINSVMIGSANEGQLAAFREHPEFESFRGRLELVRTPYLLRWTDEQTIYDSQITPQARVHVAPHATRVAAMFAVLSRLRRPTPERYERPLADLMRELTAFDKLDLYDSGKVPDRLDDDSAKRVRASIAELYAESVAYPIYEGSIGASPREMRTVLLDAAQDHRYACLSPFAVLDELDKLCTKEGEYIWLQQDAQPGGYHDHVAFRKTLRVRLLDLMEDEFRVATGLVDEDSYRELFSRYIQHVGYWVKGEKVRNPLTGAAEDPDERLMEEVETRLGYPDRAEETRRSLVSQIAGWVIENPDEPIDKASVFSAQMKRLRNAVFAEKRVAIAKLTRDLVVLLRGEGTGLSEPRREEVRAMLGRLRSRFGYEDSSAGDAAAALVRDRFADTLG
jgi:serine protein kinase